MSFDRKMWYEALTVKQLLEILEGHSIDEWREIMRPYFATDETVPNPEIIHDGRPENDWDVVYGKYMGQFGWEDVKENYENELLVLAKWVADSDLENGVDRETLESLYKCQLRNCSDELKNAREAYRQFNEYAGDGLTVSREERASGKVDVEHDGYPLTCSCGEVLTSLTDDIAHSCEGAAGFELVPA